MPVTEKNSSVTIRFPERVLSAVKIAAKKNGRSQNSEVVYLIAASLGLNATASDGERSGRESRK